MDALTYCGIDLARPDWAVLREKEKRPEGFDLFEFFARRTELGVQRIQEEAGADGGVLLRSTSDAEHYVIISRSLENKDGWRATSFDAHGPIGHTEYQTRLAALLDHSGRGEPGRAAYATAFSYTVEKVEKPRRVARKETSMKTIAMKADYAKVLAERAAPVLTLDKKPTGWRIADGCDGATLFREDGGEVLAFESANKRSGTEAMRQRTLARAYAIDHPALAPANQMSQQIPEAVLAAGRKAIRGLQRDGGLPWFWQQQLPTYGIPVVFAERGMYRPGQQGWIIGGHERTVFVDKGRAVDIHEMQVAEFVVLHTSGGQALSQIGRDIKFVNAQGAAPALTESLEEATEQEARQGVGL